MKYEGVLNFVQLSVCRYKLTAYTFFCPTYPRPKKQSDGLLG